MVIRRRKPNRKERKVRAKVRNDDALREPGFLCAPLRLSLASFAFTGFAFEPWSDFSIPGTMVVRVIAGKYRGRNLKSPPALDVRPTSDRLRETLFNVIAPRIQGVRFLDLCAGSGAVGIEALSRGAAHVTFIDRSRKMCALVKSNLDLCRIEEDESDVIQSEAQDYLRRVIGQQRAASEPWDIVFFDPPYATDYLPILETFGTQASTLLTENCLVVVEHHHRNQLPEEIGNLHRIRVLKQGDSTLSFYNASSTEKRAIPEILSGSAV